MSKPSRSFLISELDKIYSKYIRLRDTDENGFGYCITCPTRLHMDDGDCGHFIPRTVLSTRYLEVNTWLQCRKCNRAEYGLQDRFKQALIDRYGDDFMFDLDKIRHLCLKLPLSWYEEKISYYHGMVELLQRVKAMGGKTPDQLFIFNHHYESLSLKEYRSG